MLYFQLAIFICVVGIVRAGALRHEVPVVQNESTQSPVVITTPPPGHTGKLRQYYGSPAEDNPVTVKSRQSSNHQQIYASSQTIATHQRIEHPQPTNHPAPVQVGANPTVNTISRPSPTKSVTVESYGSPNGLPQNDFYDATPTSGPVYQAGNYINNHAPDVANYAINTATVTPYYAIPFEGNTVTVESNGAVNVHPLATYATHQVDPDVTYANNAATVRPYYAVPVDAKTITIQSNGAVNTHPAYATHQYSPDVTYASNSPTVRPYYAVPVEAKTVTVESNGAVHAHSPTAYSTHHLGPEVTYASNTATVRPYYAVPVQAKTVTVESNGAVHAHHPAAYATHHVGPAVTYVNNAAPLRPYYVVPVEPKTVTIKSNGEGNAHSPAVHATHHFGSAVSFANNHRAVHAHSSGQAYPENHFNTALPAAQYAGFPGVQYAVNPFIKNEAHVPIASRRGSLQSFNSVTAHPSSAPSSGLLRYNPVTVAKPIPVPVIYRPSAVETYHPSAQQFAVAAQNVGPTAVSYAQAPVRAQPIPVQVIYPAGNPNRNYVRYQPIQPPVVHANSVVERVYAPVGPTSIPVAPAGPQYGYARAVSYSPASAVSSVTFNGLGVSYGW